MQRWLSFIFVVLLTLTGCGGGDRDHAHDDHDHHKDHSHDHDHDHDHAHAGPNAHYWLDPLLTRQFIEMVHESLGQVIASAQKENRKAKLIVSIHPLASLIGELTGSLAAITTMLPQGGSPHGFELTPDILRSLGEADALIIIGGNLDPWAIKAAKNAGKKDLLIITFASLIEQHQEGHARPTAAEHPLAAAQKAMLAKIDALHDRYTQTTVKMPVKEMVTFHNAFDLLAARYGLKVVAHLTEMDLPTGAEVTPTHLSEARQAVIKFKLKTLYAEPAYPDSALSAIAEATGAKVLKLDDLGGPDRAGYRTYFEMMDSNLKVLVQGQQ